MPRGNSSLRNGVATTVGATAVLLTSTNKSDRQAIVIHNRHATNTIYLGEDANVTTAIGLEVKPDTKVSFSGEDCPQNEIWAIADGAGTNVTVHEID